MPPATTCLVLLGMLHLLARARAQERLAIFPACDAEDELLDSLRWLHEVCSHEGAVFPDDRTPVRDRDARLRASGSARPRYVRRTAGQLAVVRVAEAGAGRRGGLGRRCVRRCSRHAAPR
jgi:hypothetical protein